MSWSVFCLCLLAALPLRAQTPPAAGSVMVVLLSGRTKPMALVPPAVPPAIPERFRDGVSPVYDDEQVHAVIGFVHGSDGVFRLFDLDGRLIRMHELGLRAPAIDPISVFSGGVATGLVRGTAVGVTSAANSVVTGYLTSPVSNLRFWKGLLPGAHAAYLDPQALQHLRETRQRQAAGQPLSA